MKTQVFKKEEIYKLTVSAFIYSAILILGFLLLSGIYENRYLRESKMNSVNSRNNAEMPATVTAINDFNLVTTIDQNLEIGKLNAQTAAIADKAELTLLLEKMAEYGKPEPEPKFEINDAMFFNLSELKEEKVHENTSGTYVRNKVLEEMGRQKYAEVLELNALQKRVNDCFVVENEKPLKIEHWMMDEKCWCTESNNGLAINENR